MEFLAQAAVFFGAAVIIVPIFRRLGLGAVLGYLAAGAMIGPFGLKLFTDVATIMHTAELGVVLLLFIIGLELQPSRLWTMRAKVFGLGGAQVVLTGAAITAAAMVFGLGFRTAIVAGISLAFSSTAFVLQTLAERGELKDRHGRAAFAILLFQDLAAIPMLAIVPLLGAGYAVASVSSIVISVTKIVAMLTAVVIGGNYLLRPVLRSVAKTRTPELFTATALLIVAGTALLMDSVGISMALGAFLAGVLLANSEYRHELEADIEPFKGLLLGLFFMSVGMGLNLALLRTQFGAIVLLVLGLMALKAAVLFGLGKAQDMNTHSAKSLAMALPQGGEFAFVIFTAAAAAGLMSNDLEQLLVLVVSLSMAGTPILSLINDLMTRGFVAPPSEPYNVAPPDERPVIIAGFGRFGQIVGRVLAAKKIPFTALDVSAEHVDFVRQFGAEIYYGDASRLDLLRAAKADKAKILVLAVDDVEASLRTAESVRRHFPHITVVARARNRQHAYRLMDLGVTLLRRETFLSSLDVARQVLIGLGMRPKDAERTVRSFQAHDEKRLFEHHNYYTDQDKMKSLAKDSAKELEEMFARDAAEQAASQIPDDDGRQQAA
ncbi:MAG: monovalent cation:proton antiporter-2 (CPA2) family protein [Rhodospirillaceae bacterium]|nr:monovalent cation:proton antiporter-2 (CPA2) family protein [Rhodospirillaceae bacterium]